ncbi:mannose-6-phosphate isomerase, class I [Corynebacterium bouchesdurhonense]|uniref:mannose-6-phosphate isomerase, class I n=1 Tax=Corynebacterium bouchesdurhonense TaxID=1720192 RepID=UPI000832FC9D|nr:mannose-6-phosphate isomerase, class I [Corynebacterium bouchesdurhonense]
MEHLEGALRAYPWGSRTLLAQLRGTECPSAAPEAELWFGAHPAAPSLVGGRPLDQVIAQDPVAALGERVVAEHGEQLPFLVKLLAADEPLSIQAHPSKEQAAEGFARENALGIPLDDPRRNYKDPNPKPELIIALTPFRALAGFRPPQRTRQLFESLPGIERYAAMFDPQQPGESLRAVFTTLISLPTGLRLELLDEVAASAESLRAGAAEAWMRDAAETFLQLAERYPGDVGALAALMLNVVSLQPGEALFLAAGRPHAYLSGLGVEVMANSDNVLRGGLTSKHVDVPELARVLQFAALEDPEAPRTQSGSTTDFDVPGEYFRVSRHHLGAGEALRADWDGPAVVLCTAGGTAELSPGQAVWIPASDTAANLTAGEAGADLFYVRV